MWYLIEKILNEKKISRYKLSKLTGIPETTLASYKNDGVNPSFINVCKIADALNVSLDELREKKEKNK